MGVLQSLPSPTTSWELISDSTSERFTNSATASKIPFLAKRTRLTRTSGTLSTPSPSPSPITFLQLTAVMEFEVELLLILILSTALVMSTTSSLTRTSKFRLTKAHQLLDSVLLSLMVAVVTTDLMEPKTTIAQLSAKTARSLAVRPLSSATSCQPTMNSTSDSTVQPRLTALFLLALERSALVTPVPRTCHTLETLRKQADGPTLVSPTEMLVETPSGSTTTTTKHKAFYLIFFLVLQHPLKRTQLRLPP